MNSVRRHFTNWWSPLRAMVAEQSRKISQHLTKFLRPVTNSWLTRSGAALRALVDPTQLHRIANAPNRVATQGVCPQLDPNWTTNSQLDHQLDQFLAHRRSLERVNEMRRRIGTLDAAGTAGSPVLKHGPSPPAAEEGVNALGRVDLLSLIVRRPANRVSTGQRFGTSFCGEAVVLSSCDTSQQRQRGTTALTVFHRGIRREVDAAVVPRSRYGLVLLESMRRRFWRAVGGWNGSTRCDVGMDRWLQPERLVHPCSSTGLARLRRRRA
jgi:hypothetical protein